MENNRRYLRGQAAWGGALAAYPVFAIPYLLRLDASITLISVYVGLTALGPLVLGPAIVVYLQGSAQKRVWMLVSGFAARLGLFVPMLSRFFGENDAVFATSAFIVFAIPAIVYGALWIPIPGVAIHQDQRPELISSRIRIANSGFMVANILFGAGMIFLTFPNNYYFIFIASTFFGLLEIYNVSKIRVPKADLSNQGKLRSKLKTQKIGEERDFLLFIGVICLAIAAMSVAGPLQTVYFLKELHFSDRWMGAWAILLAFGAVVGISIWQRVQKRFGSFRILTITIPLAPLYFIFMTIFPNKYMILLAVFYTGIMNSGSDLGIQLGLYRLGSDKSREVLINLYVGISAGIGFVAAFFIPIFTDHFALTSIFIASYVLRFGLSFLFYIPRISRRLSDVPKV
ncbi:MAG: MFS transporter [Actinomycetes bacterium]